jgi:hypothetical protein
MPSYGSNFDFPITVTTEIIVMFELDFVENMGAKYRIMIEGGKGWCSMSSTEVLQYQR